MFERIICQTKVDATQQNIFDFKPFPGGVYTIDFDIEFQKETKTINQFISKGSNKQSWFSDTFVIFI